jgi:hypothetical protein
MTIFIEWFCKVVLPFSLKISMFKDFFKILLIKINFGKIIYKKFLAQEYYAIIKKRITIL